MKDTFLRQTLPSVLVYQPPILRKELKTASKGLIIKRFFDVTLAILLLILVCSWLFPLIAMVLKLTSAGPVFFKQLRHGRGNTSFYCYKFRTMVMNEDADTLQAKKDDQRITGFGSFLRKSSLDELPQLINVLQGQMSIVGPRPH